MVPNGERAKLSTQPDRTAAEKLVQLGLNDEAAEVYLTLVERGPMGALALSRELELPRTNVYRVVVNLEELGLVERIDGSRGTSIGAEPAEALERLVKERQHQVDEQKELLPSLLGEIANLSGKGPLGSRIHYFEGVKGLQQVTINSLEARSGICIYELEDMTAFAGQEFAEKMRATIVERQIHHRQLTNLSTIDGFTDVVELMDYWQVRYIDPEDLKVEFEVLIYNDVYAVYTYRDGTPFCAEIRSAALANMQRKLFDLVWRQATRMKKTDDRLGHAVVNRTKPTRRL